MISLNCYTVNPITKPEYWNSFDMVNFDYDDEMLKWQEAQNNTGTWIIFKKLTA